MIRFIMPVVLIGISITLFFMFANPLFGDISNLKTQVASYNDALNNSKALENDRDQLTAKYNAIDPANIDKLQKLLPDNVNNIRLILEIQQIAAPYGMTLTNVKYDTTNTTSATSTTVSGAVSQGGTITKTAPSNYGVFNLEFSTSGTYDNFINFTKDLESNLRIVDISSISFSSDTSVATTTTAQNSTANIYTYDFKIKTYWLKN